MQALWPYRALECLTFQKFIFVDTLGKHLMCSASNVYIVYLHSMNIIYRDVKVIVYLHSMNIILLCSILIILTL